MLNQLSQKKYFVDTNVLIDNPNAVSILSDKSQNQVIISYHVLNQLDGLKNDPKIGYTIGQVIKQLEIDEDLFEMFGKYDDDLILQYHMAVDDYLVCCCYNNPDFILVTNDRNLRLKARKLGIKSQTFKSANPFIDVNNGDYSGVVKLEDHEELVENCYLWELGKLHQHSNDLNYPVPDHIVWGVKPKSFYQNIVFDLGLQKHIDVFTIMSPAGMGKTYLTLALALEHVLRLKSFNKIYVTKAIYEIGQKLGYLPGVVEEKMHPYMKYIENLLFKLSKHGSLKDIYQEKGNKVIFNQKKFEILPINYIRGFEIEDAFVIIDEAQNLSRMEIRTLLSRMGENVKCIVLGDVDQIDNPHLNRHNNGLNWVLRKFKGNKNYGHVRLKGNKYRGPICELVVKTDL